MARDVALLYDRDCGFCTWVVDVVLRWDRAGRLRPVALQDDEAARLLPGLTPEQRLEAVRVIVPGRPPASGGAALTELLRLLPGGTAPATVLAAVPRLTERAYRSVADHRSLVSKAVPARVKDRARERVRRFAAQG